MSKNKSFYEDRKLMACALMALAVLFFIFASLTKVIVLRVFLIIFMCACFAATVYLFYKEYKEQSSRPHFFLYDKRRQKRITKEELTFPMANETLDAYLKEFTPRAISLWQGLPKQLLTQLEAEKAFAPLVAYKMLHALSLVPVQEIGEIFFGAEDRAVVFVCRAIRDSGDPKLGDTIFRMKKQGRGQDEVRAITFFAKNKRFFEARILRYIRENAAALSR